MERSYSGFGFEWVWVGSRPYTGGRGDDCYLKPRTKFDGLDFFHLADAEPHPQYR
ncbi:hypothetical protein [Rothia nasimurium]|uniref:hypothetical protein n=1 Tax=Rothia nasimurium TaxID=85336 RepID=UPI001F473FFA|nr:hypothetical protein [Rothia nasimurium]